MADYFGSKSEDFDRQYDPFAWALNHEVSAIVSAEKSRAARERLTLFADLSYGKQSSQKLDILTHDLNHAPVHIFFRGGGWLRGMKSNACFYAETIVGAGALFVAVNFPNIDEATLQEIVEYSQQAVSWVFENIEDYGGDPNRIFICGKSSGALQAGMVMAADWHSRGLPSDLVKGAVMISGIYDLEPLRHTEHGKKWGLDPTTVAALSPSRNIPSTSGPVTMVYAENDSPEIRRQSSSFAQKWRDAGHDCNVIIEYGVDHFSIFKPMDNPTSDVGQAMLRQMNLI